MIRKIANVNIMIFAVLKNILYAGCDIFYLVHYKIERQFSQREPAICSISSSDKQIYNDVVSTFECPSNFAMT